MPGRTKMPYCTSIGFVRRMLACAYSPLTFNADEEPFICHTLRSKLGMVNQHGCIPKEFISRPRFAGFIGTLAENNRIFNEIA
ncbi:hypothetical protein GCM10009000_059170 [Halobacterium noricense]|uniref:Transposase n=1 Tax=Haladaptatus pallidirubidus TaxID=1008152 RepID=A0AAV3UH25_9EURY